MSNRSARILKLPKFRRLSTRLAVQFATLFAVALLSIAIVAQVMIWSHAREGVRAAMTTSAQVYDRLWEMRARSLSDAAGVLARDFGFRSAVASGDDPTIISALDTLRQRAGGADAVVVEPDGRVIGAGSAAFKREIGRLPFMLAPGKHEAVISDGASVYRAIVSPVLAPTEIGWVVFRIRLDASEMRALEKLSAIPLRATMLRLDRSGWRAIDGSLGPSVPLQRLIGEANSVPTLVPLPTGRAFAVAKPLTGPDGKPVAALLLSYPLDAALASYQNLQIGIGLVGLLGLILVLHGSIRLARTISRPVAALGRAAQSLEEGSRTEVAVTGEDEIARLAQTFNRMSKGIVEREHRIVHMAFHDALTALPNRAFFREHLSAALTRAPQIDENIAVLCLDLDGFKGVNDTLGHPVGDALLRIVGAELTAIATDGTVARLGGDEFAVIMPVRDPDRPRALAQAIVDRMRAPMVADGHQIATGTSIGIAIGPDDGQDADTLLKNADLALYRAKQDGRGVFRFFEPALDAAARKRRQLELDLREALQTGQFRLNFQPIYDFRNDRVGGFEALLRWEHPTRGNVGPTEFIPVAEDTGLIIAIGEWVLHEACRTAMTWPDHIRVAVNVSPLQFRNPALSSVILQALARSGLAPQRLELEITESVFLDGEGPTVELLHKLRVMGIRIALDDFGTGYSSLSYLRSFPFDKIKIDRSFITSVTDDAGASAIVAAIVALAKALHMDTTAEGVETEHQAETLRSQGCGTIQGFLVSRPIESDAVAGFLADLTRQAA